MIDTYWDDPTDTEAKSNYADEVSGFSNLADLLVVNPSDDITERVASFSNLELRAVIHLNELFFEYVDANGPSGANYDLRPNYESRWDEFTAINQSVLNSSQIGTFYVGEEPTWNGITFEELNAVTNLIKEDFPTIPVMIIEAYPALNDLQIPTSVDWVGFDHYFIKNPNTSTVFQQEWQILKSKRSSASQKIMVIMDSHYIDWAHRDFGNIEMEEMAAVANNYYELAKSDEDVVGILGYFWPNGFDIPESTGARGMSQNTKAEYKRIGKEITGKE